MDEELAAKFNFDLTFELRQLLDAQRVIAAALGQGFAVEATTAAPEGNGTGQPVTVVVKGQIRTRGNLNAISELLQGADRGF